MATVAATTNGLAHAIFLGRGEELGGSSPTDGNGPATRPSETVARSP